MLPGLLLSAVLCVGLCTFLDACGPKEDGSFMLCHHVRNVLMLFGGALAVLHLLGLILPDRCMAVNGLALASVVVCICGVLIPQNIIPMCMMNTMRCHSVMRPGASVLLILVLCTDIIHLVTALKRSSDRS